MGKLVGIYCTSSQYLSFLLVVVVLFSSQGVGFAHLSNTHSSLSNSTINFPMLINQTIPTCFLSVPSCPSPLSTGIPLEDMKDKIDGVVVDSANNGTWVFNHTLVEPGCAISVGKLSLEFDYCDAAFGGGVASKTLFLKINWLHTPIVYNITSPCSTLSINFNIVSSRHSHLWDFINYPTDPNALNIFNTFILYVGSNDSISLLLRKVSLELNVLNLDPGIFSISPVPILNPWSLTDPVMTIQFGVTSIDPDRGYTCLLELDILDTLYQSIGQVTSRVKFSDTYWVIYCAFYPPQQFLVLNYTQLYVGDASLRPIVNLKLYFKKADFFICERPEFDDVSPKSAPPNDTLIITGKGFEPTIPAMVEVYYGTSKFEWIPDEDLSNDTYLVVTVPDLEEYGINDLAKLCLTVSVNTQDETACTDDSTFYYIGPNATFPPPAPQPLPPSPSPPTFFLTFEMILKWLNEHKWAYAIIASLIAMLIVVILFFVVQKLKRSKTKPIETPIDSSKSNIDIGELQIKEMIGSGSFAVVYRGYWRKTEVAIKMLQNKLKNERASFIKETTLMLKLRHPNVVTIMGIVSNPRLCIITEFCSKGDVSQVMLNPSFIVEPEHIRKICIDTCRGMIYLHGENVIHRDLKARNLLIDKDWNIKVADFGLARPYSEQPGTMTACGTPTHAAPEVIKHMHYTFKADVYSFGICLWEMCVRQEPYESLPGFQVIVAVATKRMRPKVPDSLDPRWATLIRECWTEDPDLRPQFSQLIETFEQMRLPTPLKKMPYTEEQLKPRASPLNTNSAPLEGTPLLSKRGLINEDSSDSIVPIEHLLTQSPRISSTVTYISVSNSNTTSTAKSTTSPAPVGYPISPSSDTTGISTSIKIPFKSPSSPSSPSTTKSNTPRRRRRGDETSPGPKGTQGKRVRRRRNEASIDDSYSSDNIVSRSNSRDLIINPISNTNTNNNNNLPNNLNNNNNVNINTNSPNNVNIQNDVNINPVNSVNDHIDPTE